MVPIGKQTGAPECTRLTQHPQVQVEKCCIPYKFGPFSYKVCYYCNSAEESTIDVTQCRASEPTIERGAMPNIVDSNVDSNVNTAAERDPIDEDNDGVVNSQDNCLHVANPDQKNSNRDELGDACQMVDIDKDGVIDFKDNCRWVANPDQKDEDNDGWGDVCNVIT